MRRYFFPSLLTLRFLCDRRSGRGGGLGPGSDGGPVVTWSGGGTFLQQPGRTGEVHWSALVLHGGGGEVCEGEEGHKERQYQWRGTDRYSEINPEHEAGGVTRFTPGRVTLSSECVSGCQEAEGRGRRVEGSAAAFIPTTSGPEAGQSCTASTALCVIAH